MLSSIQMATFVRVKSFLPLFLNLLLPQNVQDITVENIQVVNHPRSRLSRRLSLFAKDSPPIWGSEWQESLNLELLGAKWIRTILLPVDIREYSDQQFISKRLGRSKMKDGIRFSRKMDYPQSRNLCISLCISKRFPGYVFALGMDALGRNAWGNVDNED